MENEYVNIKKDPLIWKFCFYGLFKNLKFFEPYLIYYLMTLNISLFEIGFIYALREIIIYIFEITSGVIADYYGKKTELQICFIFYTISFIFFAFAKNIVFISIGMIFFGLGEAFRSGTHKAMMLSYLDEKNWLKHKTFIYGRTRSFSLIGSSISAILSIILVIYFPLQYLFLICIIPYVADFVLIASYPKRFNQRKAVSFSIKEFFLEMKDQLKRLKNRPDIQKIIISSSLFDAIFKILKDYIQPIIKTTIVAGTFGVILNLDLETSIKVVLGFIYAITYLLSSIASKNVYKLNKKYSSIQIMNIAFDLFAIIILFMGIGLIKNYIVLVIILYLTTYLIQNARRPAFVDIIGDHLEKDQRATVLSIESQLKSIFTIIIAPISGFIADEFGISVLFIVLGILIISLSKFIKLEF